MAKNVTKKDVTSYESLAGLKGEEILQKVKSGEIEIASAEREDFVKFAKMNPEERKSFISTLKPLEPGSGQAAADPSATTADQSAAGVTPQPGGKEVPPEPPSGGKKPDAGSEFVELVELTKLQENLKKQRQTNSKQGQQIKALTEQITELQNKLKTAETKKPDGQQQVVEMPEMPMMPDPEKFTEGLYDEKYKEAMDAYKTKVQTYKKDMDSYVKSVKPPWAVELEKELNGIQSTVKEAHEFVTHSKERIAEDETTNAWSGMWKEVALLQKATGLETPIPIETINQSQLVKLNADAAKAGKETLVYTPEEVNTALKILGQLPKQVYDNYLKITKIVNNLYTYEGGVPQKILDGIDDDLAWQQAIRKAGLQDIKAIRKVDLSPQDMTDRLAQKQANDNAAAAGMPGSQIGASEQPLNQEMTKTEKQKKLLDMTRTLRNNDKLFRDAGFMETYNKLRAEVGLAK